MKDKQLRRMIADTLWYIKKSSEFGYWVGRDKVEVHEDTIDTSYSDVSLTDILEYIDPKDYSKVFVRGNSYHDYDGIEGSQVEIYTCRKQTDKEYFDTLCSYVLPTEYQHDQYKVYLRLKKQFESE